MAFSGALTLTDLNDFITPSQTCIKPVEQIDPPKENDTGAASTEIVIDNSGSYYEITTPTNGHLVQNTRPVATKLAPARINLNDCLACSGCITSAESVLITLQSHTEVFNFLGSNASPAHPNYKLPVISIAPQSLASLAASLSASNPGSPPITSWQVLRRVEAFCRTILGFEHVFDTTFARHLALKEHVEEFLERRARDSQGLEGELPMLASACPGWICYAEKAHSEMLPYIATTKSPQQVMGTLVKEWLGTSWHKTPAEIYHVTVMPCYDKKLEASRQDFYNEIYSTRDVDCVITTGELELMMQERGWNLSTPVSSELQQGADLSSASVIPELVQHIGSSSGSYLQAIISHVQTSSEIPLSLSVKTIRNADYEEYILTEPATSDGPGGVVFRGAKCYGFRNLQNVVRKVGRERGIRTGTGAAGRLTDRSAINRKTKKDAVCERNYDYVEVMACPSGCVNGGGQLKPRLAGSNQDEGRYERNWEENGVSLVGKWGDRDWTHKVEDAYWGSPAERKNELPPDLNPRVNGGKYSLGNADHVAEHVLEEISHGAAETRRKLFRTQYRAVASEIVGLAVKW